MDPQLVDRIYECSFVPELWPGRMAEAGGSFFITNPGVTSWENTARFVNGGWFWRGQLAARLFGARHAGFLTDLDLFTLDELDLEPIYRDVWRRMASDGLWPRRFRSQQAKMCVSP